MERRLNELLEQSEAYEGPRITGLPINLDGFLYIEGHGGEVVQEDRMTNDNCYVSIIEYFGKRFKLCTKGPLALEGIDDSP